VSYVQDSTVIAEIAGDPESDISDSVPSIARSHPGKAGSSGNRQQRLPEHAAAGQSQKRCKGDGKGVEADRL